MSGPHDMIQSPARFASDLAGMFLAQQQCARTLLQILQQEREALGSGDLETMEVAAASKTASLADMEQLKAQEARALADLPFSASEEPLQQALAWCDESGTLQAEREEITRLMLECDRNNRENGILVQHRLNYVRRAINILYKAHEETLIYGSDGVSHNASSSRLLAEG